MGKVIDRVRRRDQDTAKRAFWGTYRGKPFGADELPQIMDERSRQMLAALDASQASDKPAFVLIPTPPKPRKWWELWK